jgi:hypothetical protein
LPDVPTSPSPVCFCFHQGRIEFLKRLPQALSLFDAKTVRQRVLPPLLLQVKDTQLAVFALPSVLDICRGLSAGDFERLVMPELKRLLGLCISDSRAAADERDRQERQPERGQDRPAPVPPQLSYVLLRSMDILLAKAPSAFQVRRTLLDDDFLLRAHFHSV